MRRVLSVLAALQIGGACSSGHIVEPARAQEDGVCAIVQDCETGLTCSSHICRRSCSSSSECTDGGECVGRVSVHRASWR